MIITCENCGTRFNLDESLLDVNGSTVRCSRCRHIFKAFPPSPEPEFDPLELDDSDADQTLDFDDSDFDEADDLTGDGFQESFDVEELELEAIDPDEIEIEIENADTIAAEEEEPDTKPAEELDLSEDPASEELDFLTELEPETPDLSKELDKGADPGFLKKNDPFLEDLDLDGNFSEDKEPDFDLAFDLDEKQPETEELDLEIPEDIEPDIGDSKTSSSMEDSDFLKKEASKDDTDTGKPHHSDHDEQGFDGLDDFDDPDFDETDTSDTSFHPPPPPRRPARASLTQPVDPETEWMEEEADPPPKKRSPIGLPVLLVLVLFLLAAGGYLAATFLGYKIPFLPDIRIPFIHQYLPDKTVEPVSFPEPLPDQKSVTGRFLTNDSAGELFIITGKIENPAPVPYRGIQVKGTLFQKEKKPVMSQVAFCGNIIPEDTLKTASVKDLISQLETPPDINDRVMPQAAIPFMLVFSDLPRDLENFTVEVAGFDRATP